MLSRGCLDDRAHRRANREDGPARRATQGRTGGGSGRLELRMAVRQAGSLMHVAFAGESDEEAARMHRNFHLASLNHGAFIAPRGLIALSTVITDELMTEICERFSTAMIDVAASG